MIRRRHLLFFLAVLLAGSDRSLGAADAGAAVATVKGLCDALIAAMKQGSTASFPDRVRTLGPEIRQDFDLGLMSRIIVGPPWRQLGAQDRQDMVDAFSDYSVANYAQRFKSYSGERFEVDPAPAALANGDCIVSTKLFTGDPQPVQLNYLMRLGDGKWRIIDVFLSGTISEMAARRSEYALVLRTGGVPALVDLLRKKTADLAK
jgi:phospholipid transport system substrate-binding protein